MINNGSYKHKKSSDYLKNCSFSNFKGEQLKEFDDLANFSFKNETNIHEDSSEIVMFFYYLTGQTDCFPLGYVGDTISSCNNILNQKDNINNLIENSKDEEIKTLLGELWEKIDAFDKLKYTIGNLMPVPKEFNVPRSNKGQSDYVNITLEYIFDIIKNNGNTDKAKELIYDMLVGAGTREEHEIEHTFYWLSQFKNVEDFKEIYFFDDYEEFRRYTPKKPEKTRNYYPNIDFTDQSSKEDIENITNLMNYICDFITKRNKAIIKFLKANYEELKI